MNEEEKETLKKVCGNDTVRFNTRLNFGKNLKKQLTEKGLTQSKLEELSGIASSNITGYIKGEAEPPISTLVKIANALGVSVNHLLGEHENNTIDNELIRNKIGLNDNSIESLNELYRTIETSVPQVTSTAKRYIEQFKVLNRLLSDRDFVYDFTHEISIYISNVEKYTDYFINKQKETFNIKDLKKPRRELLFEVQELITNKIDKITNEIITEVNKEG